MFRFHFWEPVFFNAENSYFPSDILEERGRFVGISDNVGHHMTFKILNSSTNKIINRSNVRSSSDKEYSNLRADFVTSPDIITSLQREKSEDNDATSETSRNK